MKTKQIARLLKFTTRGHVLHYSAEGSANCTCSGYEDPAGFVKPYHWWAHPEGQMTRHFDGYDFPAEGIPVIDIREAVDTPEGYRWVFKGPLLNVDLDEGEIERLPEVSPIMMGAVAAFGQTAALLETVAAKAENKAGPLDGVSVGEYVKGWREHGAKVGRCYVENSECRIEWE